MPRALPVAIYNRKEFSATSDRLPIHCELHMLNFVWDSDFLSNIVAEALGIIVTVFVIDRLLAIRDRRRWSPAKSVAFGAYRRIITWTIIRIGHTLDLWGGDEAPMYPQFVKDVSNALSLERLTDFGPDLSADWNTIVGLLANGSERLGAITNRFGFLIQDEPKLYEVLAQFEDSVNTLRNDYQRTGEPGSAALGSAVAFSWLEYILSFIVLKSGHTSTNKQTIWSRTRKVAGRLFLKVWGVFRRATTEQ